MDQGITPPVHEVAPYDHIASGLTGVRILLVNVYAVSQPGGSWTLFDAGLPFSAAPIRRWAAAKFGNRRPAAIVLTHAHFDHVGALRSLAGFWDVPVYAHPLELPYLTGGSSYPPPEPGPGGEFMSPILPLYPRGTVDVSGRVRELPGDGSVPTMPGWRWIHTPGHTPGHVSFFRDEDRVLIAGDAFVTAAAARPEFHGPPACYTQDWEAARLSVARLAALMPDVAAAGHGTPVSGGEMLGALQFLAQNFDTVARPTSRRARTPAVAGDRGLAPASPEPASTRIPKTALVTVLAGTALLGIMRWRRDRG